MIIILKENRQYETFTNFEDNKVCNLCKNAKKGTEIENSTEIVVCEERQMQRLKHISKLSFLNYKRVIFLHEDGTYKLFKNYSEESVNYVLKLDKATYEATFVLLLDYEYEGTASVYDIPVGMDVLWMPLEVRGTILKRIFIPDDGVKYTLQLENGKIYDVDISAIELINEKTKKQEKPLEISKMLIISTAHISKATNELLENNAAGIVAYPKGEYGWLILVNNWKTEKKYITSDVLKKVLTFAESKGCDWLMLDRDAAEVDELPIYEW